MVLDAARGFVLLRPTEQRLAEWRRNRDQTIAADRATVELFAAAMAAGEWQARVEGRLIARGQDGRHRLVTVIKQGARSSYWCVCSGGLFLRAPAFRLISAFATIPLTSGRGSADC